MERKNRESSSTLEAISSNKSFFSLFLLFVVFVLEMVIILKLDAKSISGTAFLLMHIAISASFASTAHLYAKNGKDTDLYPVYSLLISLLGPFGAGGALLMVLLLPVYRRYFHGSNSWINALPFDSDSCVPRVYERIGLTSLEDFSRGVLSYQDVMRLGVLSQKQQALSNIARNFSAPFSEVLKDALNAKENAVRVQAASAMSKLEADFIKTLLVLKKKRKAQPDDLDLLLELARHYDFHGVSGLLDAPLTKDNCTEAIALYRKYLKYEPGDVEVKARIGKLYLQKGEYDNAARWMQKCLEEDKIDYPDMVMWYLEALYALGQFTKLRSFARRYFHGEFKCKKHEYKEYSQDIAEKVLSLWSASG